jgi:parallel beta-helix repeat protein
MRLVRLLVLAVSALGLVADGAAAQTVQCGQTITQDVRLDSDLTCDSTALTIGADGVTVDLDGHTLSFTQPSSPPPPGSPFPIGIDDSAGYDGLTVRDGTIRGFFTGVALTGASRSRIVNVESQSVGFGISISGGSRNEVRGTTASGEGTGIEVAGSDHARIVGSSGLSSQVGIRVSGNSGLIAFNRIDDAVIHSAIGINVSGSGNSVVANRVRFAYSTGIFVAGARSLVLGNVASDGRRARFSPDASGLVVSASDTLVLANRANRNEDDGIAVLDASDRLIGNVANDNGALGIRAVPGVFAVGNRASGNGDPRQCLNLVCR